MNAFNVATPSETAKVPQVSIGMPVCNGAEFIRVALDTLLAQTFSDFELIISDNASTDGTEAICREYSAKDVRIRYVRQVENLGATANFQLVLNEAVGEYFMWAAHDDYYSNVHLSALISELHKHSDAVVSMSATTRIYQNLSVLDVIRYTGRGDPNKLSKLGLAWRLAAGELYHVYIYGLFKRAFLKSAFRHYLIVVGADRLFICKIALTERFRYVDQLSYFRRVYDTPASLRYKSTDPVSAELYGSRFQYIKSLQQFTPYMYRHSPAGIVVKIFVPILFVRYLLFLCKPIVANSVRTLAHHFFRRR